MTEPLEHLQPADRRQHLGLRRLRSSSCIRQQPGQCVRRHTNLLDADAAVWQGYGLEVATSEAGRDDHLSNSARNIP